MKRIFLSALVGALLGAAIFQISSASEAAGTPENYPLVCRGGGSLVTGVAPGERNIGFTFVRGTKPAGEGLGPGECSWKDRGMYPNEPDRVSQHVEEGSESLKVGGTLAAENRWYEELHSADSYWTFMVSNNGRGQLIASSARPNNAKSVSPTAIVPPAIGQILRRDLPRARTPDDETPKLLVLNAPADPGSIAGLRKGSPVARDTDIPPAPPPLTKAEKMALLKSTGLEALDDSLTPDFTLTPLKPQVTGKGALLFSYPSLVYTDYNDLSWVSWRSSEDSPDFTLGGLIVILKFQTKGIYLMTLTVHSEMLSSESAEFSITSHNGGATQKFLAKMPKETHRLNMFVEVTKPGEYSFGVTIDTKREKHWDFYSCEVTALKK